MKYASFTSKNFFLFAPSVTQIIRTPPYWPPAKLAPPALFFDRISKKCILARVSTLFYHRNTKRNMKYFGDIRRKKKEMKQTDCGGLHHRVSRLIELPRRRISSIHHILQIQSEMTDCFLHGRSGINHRRTFGQFVPIKVT